MLCNSCLGVCCQDHSLVDLFCRPSPAPVAGAGVSLPPAPQALVMFAPLPATAVTPATGPDDISARQG